MAGTVENARLWTSADVYVGDDDATIPTDIFQPFNGDWDLVGLLDPAGGNEEREEQVNDLFAFGGVLVQTARSQFKMSMTFTALEDSQTTFDLVYPGSTYGSVIVVPQVVPRRIAFEFTDSSREVVKRVISANYAEITVDGGIPWSDADLQKFPLRATFVPDATQAIPELLIHQVIDYS